MANHDSRVDAYIAKSAEFAKPILRHLRGLIHKADPEMEETLKWGMPSFMHKGIVCGMAAFKQHCTFGFWKHDLVFPKGDGSGKEDQAMGQFGRITALTDLPTDGVLLATVKKAVRLNEEGVKVPRPKPGKEQNKLVVPDYFVAALAKNKRAQATFEAFSCSHKKEYVEWIVEAKREETRQKRIQTALEWLAKGKARNWKYQRC